MPSVLYHESKQRGSLDFPLDYHYIDEHHSRYEMPFHWHEEFEILHVLKGTFALSVGREEYRLGPGDFAFVAAGLLHGGIPGDCVYECVVFDMRLLLKSNDHCKQHIGNILHGRIAVHPHFPAGGKVTRHTLSPMFDSLREQSDGYALITLGCLFQFVGEVYKFSAYERQLTPYGRDAKRVLKLKKIFELVEGEYTQPLTLGRLSAAAGMTPKYFCRFFKQATHRSPMDYVSFYRTEMACYEMAATEKNVTEIAMDMGFSDVNYFIRTFRKHKGMTPGQYLTAIRPRE